MRTSRLLLPLVLALPVSAQAVDDAYFEQQVLPILEARCFECHGPRADVKAGLRLTSLERVHRGGDSGASVDLERPQASRLLRMLSYATEYERMPPEGKLPDAELAVLTAWIKAGAPWSANVTIEVEQEHEVKRLTKGDGLEGWAYQPVVRPERPPYGAAEWTRSPLDEFIVSRLEAAGLGPAPEADKRTLLRRVTYDLTGLPPTEEELAAFLADTDHRAFERVVERLLASPGYGIRWGRHWLDLMRYAETNGYERDSNKPFIYRYRDYVIDAFNADKPYDRFLIEQLAGDELPDANTESIIATGYNRLMVWDDEPGNGRLQARYDILDDLVRSTSEGMLGMTLGCARCHDHKGDDLSAVDYYSFMAFFEGLEDIRASGNLVDVSTPEEQRELEAAVSAYHARMDELNEGIAAIEQDFRRKALTGGVASGLSDLKYRFYRDSWSEIPDFDMLLPEDEGELPSGLFDLSPATRNEAFGFVFEGRLSVPVTGTYRFTLDSDDGSRLYLDGEAVVERDGHHPLGEPQTVELELTAGSHPIRLDYIQGGGGFALVLDWEPVGADVWLYTEADPGPGWEGEAFDASAWNEGPGGFGPGGGTEWSTPGIWLRRTFEWDGQNAADLALLVKHDEDVEVFLNGVRALRKGGYQNHYSVEPVSAEARAAVRQGSNVIAVHCRQTTGGQFCHVRPIHESDTLGNKLEDLVKGRRSLSASSAPDQEQDIARQIERDGERHLGKEEFERWRELRKQRDQHRRRGVPRASNMANAATPRTPHPPQMHVHVRGSVHVQGKPVEPAFPATLGFPTPDLGPLPEGARSSGRRLALARWIASEDNPLTARVMVNRIWQHHFGRGIVPSTSDFGELGERPTHPDLLDWLAVEFMESGWSIKHMHRVMLLSSTYRMAYRPGDATTANVDPNNDLLWRTRMRRLSAEEVRDSVLWLTGKLNPQMGGESFFSLVSEEARATSSQPGNVWGNSSEEQRLRRSVYIKVKRSLGTPLLQAFDQADTDNPCPERFTTTQPGQALALLNGEFSQVRSADVARRLEEELPGDLRGQLTRLLELALSRPADDAHLAELADFHRELREDHGLDAQRALANCCLLVINLNEFVYLD
ncbi:MAG: DUF1553 domain-containing protein [Planctomycetota bacterium]|nr:DUF1553 domain-containing protein [Planctomycetota bacterium]